MTRKLGIFLLALIACAAIAWAAQPTAYTPTYDFSDLEAADPDMATLGTKLDVEFGALNTTADNILTNLALIQRDDGELANQSVGVDQLDDVLLANMGVTEGVWATATEYEEDDVIITSNKIYICLIDHTSGTFSTDLAALKWELIADFTAGAMNITGLTALSGADSTADVLPIYDDSAAANKKITYPDLMEGINVLTAETAPAVADKLAIYDASAGTADSITPDNFLKIIDSLTAETAPATDDKVAVYDTSGASADGMTLASLFNVVGSLTAETAVAVDDSVALYDLSETATNSMSVTDLFEAINMFTVDSSPDTAADYTLTYDASASTVKKVLLSSLGNTGIAGVQFFTASGTWTKETGATKALVFVVGGGGGGGGADAAVDAAETAAGGGGGGGVGIEWITSGLGSTETVTIGAAGAAGATAGGNGGAGGTTSFGSHCDATGGALGSGTGSAATAGVNVNGGLGGTGSGCTVNLVGGDGQPGNSSGGGAAEDNATGGAGGSTMFGGGGRGGLMSRGDTNSVAPAAGNSYGGGGGGAATPETATNGQGGAAGAGGAVLVISFY